MEMLFSTPVKPSEILLSKVIPYFIVGMGGLFLCLFAARFIFEVPIQGSLAVIIGSSCIYLLTALGALDFGADKESVPGFPACDSDQFPAVRDAERLRL